MVDRSDIPKALVLADRNYESYNNLAHIQQKNWAFLFRIKDGKTGIGAGLALPDSDEFDVPIHLKITNRMTNDVKKLLQIGNCCKYIPRRNRFDFLPKKCDRSDPVQFYELSFRIVRFKISDDSFETIITNLEQQSFPVSELKQLYAMRWGIETSFRDLKYTLGLLHLHSKRWTSFIGNLCKAYYVQLLPTDYPIRSHPTEKEEIRLQGQFLRCHSYLPAILSW